MNIWEKINFGKEEGITKILNEQSKFLYESSNKVLKLNIVHEISYSKLSINYVIYVVPEENITNTEGTELLYITQQLNSADTFPVSIYSNLIGLGEYDITEDDFLYEFRKFIVNPVIKGVVQKLYDLYKDN